MKKQIYLSADYETLITKNGYFVDKTYYIQKLEKFYNPNVFFLRPRRFGKSLLLSMLEHYYGIQYKDRFEEFFGEYYIGKPENTTPGKNIYYTLHFDFSGIATDVEKDIMGLFNEKLFIGFRSFISNYNFMDKEQLKEIINKKYPSEILGSFISILISNGFKGKIFILIDEYDHFTNELFAFKQEHFQEVVSRNGWVRKFYEVIKQFVGSGQIERFFATGVAPVTLDSMTSGFNIATNVTLDLNFHNMAGFTELELKELILGTIYEEGKFEVEKLLTDMRAWFNGSRFSPDGGDRLYNPQMTTNFLSNYQSNFAYPKTITDNNVTSDWIKIRNILMKLPQKDSDSILEKVYIDESIEGSLATQFNLETPYRLTDAISILFYNGLLTIDKEEYGIIRFVMPNYVIKNIFWEYLRISYEQAYNISFELTDKNHIFKQMAIQGKITLLIEEVSKIMIPLMSNDYQNFSESNLKMIVISILSLNRMYIINSEMEVTGGRVDLLLTKYAPFNSNYQFLIEFKYIKMKDEKLNTENEDKKHETKYEKTKKEGIAQLKKYLESDSIRYLENLKSYLIIFREKRKGEIIEVASSK